MDLRVKRTQKSIKDAFYALRKKKKLEKISVKELSEAAMINKATFYLHYRDIYDLSEKIENELISEILDEVRGYNLSLGKGEAQVFYKTLGETIISRFDEIQTVFSENDNRFIDSLEDRLKKYIFSDFPSIADNDKNNILLTLFIQGFYRVYIRNPDISPDVIASIGSEYFIELINDNLQ